MQAARKNFEKSKLDPDEIITIRRGLDTLSVTRLENEVYSLKIMAGIGQTMG